MQFWPIHIHTERGLEDPSDTRGYAIQGLCFCAILQWSEDVVMLDRTNTNLFVHVQNRRHAGDANLCEASILD
jgi:hypothetical protein